MEIRFTVPGVHKGKQRARNRLVRKKDGSSFVSTYTPSETRNQEALVRDFAQKAMGNRPPLEGPIKFNMCAYLPVPPSWSNKKRADAIAGKIFPIGKPDFDNYAKLISDAINQLVFVDDSQIVTSTIYKRYSDRPRLSVVITQQVP